MSQELIHVYLMPGMAANPTIFENIKLPINKYKIHLLEWFIPIDGESIVDYAKRMLKKVDHENSVLIGVSFGGILVQEMAKLRSFRKLIIISSVKTNLELPKKMKVVKATKIYKILPTSLVSNIDMLAKYVFGETANKRLELYKKYLSVNDKQYLDWAIEQMVCWEQEQVLPEVIHIHGDKDPVFPIKNIENCITIKGGTHIMIINKYKWFNENLPIILER